MAKGKSSKEKLAQWCEEIQQIVSENGLEVENLETAERDRLFKLIDKITNEIRKEPTLVDSICDVESFPQRQKEYMNRASLLLHAQTYCKIVQSVSSAPVGWIDLELNGYYQRVISTIQHLLSLDECKDFPGGFEPVNDNIFPESGILDIGWEDGFAGSCVDFLSRAQQFFLQAPVPSDDTYSLLIYLEWLKDKHGMIAKKADEYAAMAEIRFREMFKTSPSKVRSKDRKEETKPTKESASEKPTDIGQSQPAETMSKIKFEKISAIIKKLDALEKAKEKYCNYHEEHSKAHLGLGPDSTENALWLEVQSLIDKIDLDLVESWGVIEQYNTEIEDDFGGWVIPTGTFSQNLSRDIEYAINSRNLEPVNTLNQHLKKVKRRLEIKAQGKQREELVTHKPAGTEQKPETVKKPPALQDKLSTWQHLSIEVVDDDTVRYKIGGGKWKRVNYTQLGFLDKRRNRANQLWPIFLGLAGKNLPSNINRPTMKSKDIDRIRDTLRRFFGIKNLPIKYDKRTKEYRCHFTFNDPRDWTDTLQNENLSD